VGVAPGGEEDRQEGEDGPGDDHGVACGDVGVRQARQVGDGCGHQQLEQRLGASDVAGLANPELYQPRDPMLDHLPPSPVLPTGRAGLLGPGGVQ
jgi:hypothetical protein